MSDESSPIPILLVAAPMLLLAIDLVAPHATQVALVLILFLVILPLALLRACRQ